MAKTILELTDYFICQTLRTQNETSLSWKCVFWQLNTF